MFIVLFNLPWYRIGYQEESQKNKVHLEQIKYVQFVINYELIMDNIRLIAALLTALLICHYNLHFHTCYPGVIIVGEG